MSNKKILNFIPNFSFGGVETTNINLTEKLIDFENNQPITYCTKKTIHLRSHFQKTTPQKMRDCAKHVGFNLL